jgi:hypothetical protein
MSRWVVIEVGLCLSARTGSAARSETSGYWSGLEEGKRLRGGKAAPLGRQEAIGGDA